MSINYGIYGFESAVKNPMNWVEKNLPHLISTKFLQFGTEETLNFQVTHPNARANKELIELSNDELLAMEALVKSISDFNFDLKCRLKKYNPHKKVFIVDLLQRVGEELEESETIEALTILSCQLNEDNSFTIVPESIETSVASCYGGEDEWGAAEWLPSHHHNSFENIQENEVFRSGNLKHIQLNDFISKFIDDLFKQSIKDNLSLVEKMAAEVALV